MPLSSSLIIQCTTFLKDFLFTQAAHTFKGAVHTSAKSKLVYCASRCALFFNCFVDLSTYQYIKKITNAKTLVQ